MQKVMKTKKNIVLLGMMGSGKTTIGELLSKKIKSEFIDIDKKIEEIEQLKIEQIFAIKGEDYFRKIEHDITQSYLKINETLKVISLGGGAFLNKKLRQTIKDNSLSFWLDWESATLVKRLKKSSKRPLIKGLNENQIKKMLIERNKFYAKSDHRIKCENHKKNEIVDKIVIVLKRNEN
tara:strand:- start:9790 stop:10326 length:537 start_codon:yes stop_codon:yes gene_type:complete